MCPALFAAPVLESVLVTAHAPEAVSSQHATSVEQLDAEAIRAQQAVNTAQLLSSFEGVYASVEGGPGGVSSLSVRGAEPNFTVVLIDGVAVNDPTNVRGGSFDLATLSSSHIRGVELVKGAHSLAYGSDALSGVLKVLTGPGQASANQLSLENEWRGRGAYRRSVQLAGVANTASGSHVVGFQAANDDSGELWQGSERSLQEHGVHYRFDLEPARFQLGSRQARFDKRAYPEQSGGPRLASTDDQDVSEGEDLSAYLSASLELHDNWLLSAQYTQYDRDFDFYSPGIAPYNNVPENFYDADYQRRQWRLVNQLNWQNWSLGFGIDRRAELGESRGAVVFTNIPADAVGFLLGLPAAPVETGASIPVPIRLDTDYRLSRDSNGLFAELGWAGDSGLWASLGLRQDSTDGDREQVARYAFGAEVSENWQVGLYVSEGFKLPSFFALGHGLVGNPDLKPERARSVELSLAGQYRRWQWDVALFDNEYRDLIDFDPDNFTNVNRNRVNGRGTELSASWQSDRIDMSAGYTFVETNIEDSERDLANRPEQLLHFDVNWRFAENWSWYQRVSWVDEQHATSLHTGETRAYLLDDYLLWDMHVRWRASEHLGVYAGVENALDTDYEEAVGFPGPKRWFRLGFSLSL